MMHVPEAFRIRTGDFGSDPSYGNNGAFFVPRRNGAPFKVIASDGEGWEHVSVSLHDRTPTWAEMCRIVALFWDPEDTIMQLHPPRAQWINNHPYCLHLWRPIAATIPLPPSYLVGYQSLNPPPKGEPS